MPTTGRAARSSAGSSSINAMVWIRGAPEPTMTSGRRRQSRLGFWDDLLPAFKAIEDNQAGATNGAGGRPGPCHRHAPGVHPLTQRYLKAAEQAGLPLNPDFNGASQEGVGIYQISTETAGACRRRAPSCARR
jgi:choline dehydrogenase